MIKAIIQSIYLATLVFLFAGCVATPVALTSAADNAGPVYATLADANNPIDMAAAPVVTRLAVYTGSVTKALKAGQISKQYAINCRDRERDLRRQLESAVARHDMSGIRAASATLDGYVNDLEALQ
jgi:hypothetical protein